MSTVQSIIIRPAKKAQPIRLETALVTSTGIEGDHYSKPGGYRQVSIIAMDDLAKVAALVGFQGDIHIASRRNIMVDTLPDQKLKGKIVTIGNDVELEITGYCTPCFRMNENFGEGAISGFEQRAGWIAKVIRGGSIAVGDSFTVA